MISDLSNCFFEAFGNYFNTLSQTNFSFYSSHVFVTVHFSFTKHEKTPTTSVTACCALPLSQETAACEA